MSKKTSKFPPKKPTQTLFKAAVKHNWSDYQKAIFKEIAFGNQHCMVIARAGSSKTSTLIEGSKYIPKGKKSLFCAFNKSIQEELKNKLNERIECSTLHSLGYRGIRQRFGNVELDDNKCWNIVEDLIGNSKENYGVIDNVCKTITLCKANLADIPSKVDEIILEYDIDLCEYEPEIFIKYVLQGLRKCKEQTNVIDFMDMIWFPFIYRINVGKYDVVFVDEAQDMSKCMIELALSAIKTDGRVFAVLDDKQAIYRFMGADHRVLYNLRTRLNPKELSLPICYRCPIKVVALAQEYVPDILPYDKSPEGEIINLNILDLHKHAKAGSYVLSRTNAPLIRQCMLFLKQQIPANILGRDIGNNLLYLIKKSKKKNVKSLLEWLVKWEKQEKENLLIKYPKANTEFIADKAECIRMLCEDASSLEEVKSNINNLFQENDENKIVLFSSIHKIKGKQASDVFILSDTIKYSNEEECNIYYVGITRAQQKLFFVKK